MCKVLPKLRGSLSEIDLLLNFLIFLKIRHFQINELQEYLLRPLNKKTNFRSRLQPHPLKCSPVSSTTLPSRAQHWNCEPAFNCNWLNELFGWRTPGANQFLPLHFQNQPTDYRRSMGWRHTRLRAVVSDSRAGVVLAHCQMWKLLFVIFGTSLSHVQLHTHTHCEQHVMESLCRGWLLHLCIYACMSWLCGLAFHLPCNWDELGNWEKSTNN